MDIHLTLYETRVLGSLIEKEKTTSDQYPLSLNALTNACNQKSNRDPVLEIEEETVQVTVDELAKKHLVVEQSSFGSRVVKFEHRICNTEASSLSLTEQELGIICVLFLRGPQTPGELRSRTNRLCQFSDVQEVESILKDLIEKDDGPYIVKLPREAGKRESRYAHLFSGEVETTDSSDHTTTGDGISSQDCDRISSLEQRVEEMQDEIAQIKCKLEELIP